MKGEYETQAFVARRDDTHRGFVWRCARCGRYIGVIEALTGRLRSCTNGGRGTGWMGRWMRAAAARQMSGLARGSGRCHEWSRSCLR